MNQHTESDYNALEALTTSLHATVKAQGSTIIGLQTRLIEAQSNADDCKETIKGLDRALQRYKEIIEQYRVEALEMQKKIHELEQEHAQKDVSIDRLHDNVTDKETVIKLQEHKKGGQ